MLRQCILLWTLAISAGRVTKKAKQGERAELLARQAAATSPLPAGSPRSVGLGSHLSDMHDALELLGESVCSETDACMQWKNELAKWRSRVLQQEKARIETHFRLFGVSLTHDDSDHKIGQRRRSYGPWSIFDLFESEYSCMDDRRVPESVLGKGPKFFCGPEVLPDPCVATSLGLGSPSDNVFEAAMYRYNSCHIHVIEPKANMALKFQLKEIGATLNTTADLATVQLPDLIPNTSHLTWLKIDLPRQSNSKITLDLLSDLINMCANSDFTIDHLNVAFHLDAAIKPNVLYYLFHHLRVKCHLMLFHKERDLWTVFGDNDISGRHCDFAWVSFRHAYTTSTQQIAYGPGSATVIDTVDATSPGEE